MKLATTTLIGPGTVELLDDALASVAGWVDLAILIPTSLDVDDREVMRAAKRAGIHGKRALLQRWGWCDDFSAARNEALDIATRAGADWALTLDTDERYRCDPPVLRALLEPSRLGAYYVSHASGSYTQARLVQLPTSLRFSGRTHEALPAYQLPTLTLSREVLAFSDVPKTPEQLQIKFQRDRQILEEETLAKPLESRWHFYLGETRRNLGDVSGARLAYDRCAELRGWDEESAWACYRAAECCCALALWQEAIDRCANGLARHAAFGELAWLAGFAAYKLGRDAQAVCWCAMAVAVGQYQGVGRAFPRIGFQHPPGLYEGPYDVMAHAWERMGKTRLADVARAKLGHAQASRDNGGLSMRDELAIEFHLPTWKTPTPDADD